MEQTDVSQCDLNNCEDVRNLKQKCLINSIFKIVYILAILLKNH